MSAPVLFPSSVAWFESESVSKIDQQLRPLGKHTPPTPLVSWGFQMSSLQQRVEAINDTRLTAITDTRLATITDTAANLKAQLNDLNQLRDQIRKAQQLPRRSRRTSA
jgi:hypothetical protein